jgi:hypothetical protein
MRRSVSTSGRSVTRPDPHRTLASVFRTELTKRRAIDLVRVAGMLCLMP